MEREQQCRWCGQPLNPQDRYCSRCGFRIGINYREGAYEGCPRGAPGPRYWIPTLSEMRLWIQDLSGLSAAEIPAFKDVNDAAKWVSEFLEAVISKKDRSSSNVKPGSALDMFLKSIQN